MFARNDIDELFRTINGGQKDYIECGKLVEFLNDKQRDPRLNEILYPHYNEARVMEIVTRYESDPELINKVRTRRNVNTVKLYGILIF